MAEQDVFIWHNLDGTIVAVGRAAHGLEERIEPIAAPHQRVLRMRVPQDHVASLHQTHRVDLITGSLRACNEPPEASKNPKAR
jgi:hypothetical protein